MCVLVTHVRNEKALREKKNESESTMVCFSVGGDVLVYVCCKCVCVLAVMSG